MPLKKVKTKTPKVDCKGIKCYQCILFKFEVIRKGKIYPSKCLVNKKKRHK
jgi:hypothetical protein